MKLKIFQLTCFLMVIRVGNSYNKYGRKCSDIGCRSNEVCVMAEDPCSFYQRDNECGSYPTCQKINNGGPSCDNFVCPPTQKCVMSGGNPKCVSSSSGSIYSSIDDKQNSPVNTAHNPSAPLPPQGVYPNLRPGQTTPRSPIYRPGQAPSRGGYQGGAVGSGYPGQPQSGGYPSNGGYPSQGGYPYGSGSGGYYGNNPGSGYPGNGYQPYPYNPQSGGYPYYNNPNYRGRYGQKSSASDSLIDKITQGLKNWGLFCLVAKHLVSRAFGFA